MRENGKRANKNYSFWLENEMDDYYLDAPDTEDVITSIQTKYDKGQSSNKAKNQDNQTSKKTHSRYKNHVKFSEKFNFVETFKEIPDTAITKISLFLTLKDISTILTTCKLVNGKFDNTKCWKERGFRDFTNLRVADEHLSNVNIKQVYRFLHSIETKSELRYDSRAFEANDLRLGTEVVRPYVSKGKAPPKTPTIPSAELSKTLIDSISAKTPLLSHYIYQMIPGHCNYSAIDFKGTSWQPNLNLSWLERRSGVQLWIGGVVDHKPTAKNLRSIRLLGDEVGQKAYFYGDKYVIIESKLLVSTNSRKYSEEEKTSNDIKENPEQDQLYSVTIADLEEAFKNYCMNSSQHAWRYCFCLKALETERDNKVEKIAYEQGSVIEVDTRKEDITEAKIHQTISKEGLRMFYTKNTSSASLFIFDPKEKDSYLKVSLNLESPLSEAFLTKKLDEKDIFTVFIVDQALNLYTIKYSQENELKISKICLRRNQDKELEQEGEARKGIFKIQKEFHHQVFASVGKEFLIAFKGRIFYLVDLENLNFCSLQLAYNNYGVAYDWHIYNENLYVFENNDIVSYRLRLSNLTIQRDHPWHILAGYNMWRYENYSRRWISMNPCYTVYAEATPYFTGQKSILNVSIVSTQQIIKKSSPFLSTWFSHSFTIKLENFIDEAEYDDRIKEIAENMNIKIEDSTLVVQTSKRSWIVDLEAYRKSGPRFIGQTMTLATDRNCNVLGIPEEEKKKKVDPDAKKEKPKHVEALNSIHENWNHGLAKNRKQKTDWSGSNKKDETKEEREQDRVIRQKGDKYYKNVRHDQFVQKIV